MLKAIIFDMDGVLVDSELIHYQADKEMLKNHYDIDMDFEYYKQYIGGTVDNMWNGIIRDFGIQNTSAYELNLLTDEIIEKMTEKTGYPAVAGVVRFVQMLKRETSLRLAVASSSSMSKIEHNIENLNISECFDILVSGQSLQVSKPDPAIFLKTAEAMEIKPSECLVIEDSENGVMAAVNAGIPCIGFINPNSGNQNLSEANAAFESFENLDIDFIKMIYSHAVGEPAVILETERLLIREISVEDVPRLYELYDEEIVKYMPGLFEKIDEEMEYTKNYIKNIYGFYHYGMWLVVLKESNVIIGRAGVEYKEIPETKLTHEMGYMIGKKYQGKGYAKEALSAIIEYMKRNFEINNFFVEVSKENEKSISLARKMGFVFENKVNVRGYLVGELL
ncbi:MAG: GNAT family N-acetyltransferase [Lachnospiraceae bacterium]|nr:GNAT family N-acetyltransferase [Lachnospiraceae bacterium]